MRKSGIDLRLLLALLALVVAAGVIAIFAVGGSSGSSSSHAKARADNFEAAGVITPAQPAPPLALRNYLGRPVNIAAYRGKAVLVTFLYTHCPDICPLITAQLHNAQVAMGAANAAKLQVIAVSVDPKGDTRQAVAAFLAAHQMTGRMEYLVGSAHELGQVWQAWGVGAERDASRPESINHTGLVYGITGSGKRITLYAPTFKPADIAHDVPLLAAQ
jgi:protein SCO1/2